MEELSRDALARFDAGFNCAQAVLAAFSTSLSLDTDTALKIACPFGAGMGRLQNTCGAVTGAFMVLGMKFGKSKQEDDEAKEKTFRLVKELAAEFTKINGSISCRKLIDCDLSTSSGMEYARKYKLFDNRCTKFIKDAVEIVTKQMEPV